MPSISSCAGRCFDGRIFDQPPQTVERYLVQQTTSDRIVWRFNNKVRAMPANRTLRVETLAPAVVHWSVDGWRTVHDTATRDTTLGVHVVDLGTRDLRRWRPRPSHVLLARSGRDGKGSTFWCASNDRIDFVASE